MIIEYLQRKEMMKYGLSILFLLVSVITMAQIKTLQSGSEGEEPCYKKKERLAKDKFGGWECGKLAGVVDCNTELDYDQEHDLILKKAVDNVNLAGVGKPFTGTCESCYMSGILERRITFLNGQENGTDTTYYESGCPQVIRTHIQGAESGTWTFFYDSTQAVAWEMNYYLGEKNGRQVYMKPNGDTTKEESYKNGVLHGVRKSFYRDSKIFKEATYANGVLNGPFKTYNKEGMVIEELNYLNNEKDGVQKYYYDDGVLLRTENWSEGVKNGEFKMFYYQGFPQTIETYKKGVKYGKFEEYYPDGKPKKLSVYEKGELIEEHQFDELGNETYSFGAPVKDGAEDDAVRKKDKKK